ncbi:hypothetical protein E2C01_101747 [Portunus trituberculatus]|uniref:Uncharacterized protein n=1 Tax=Portunus trituberculatus TaxID=210409 RepID=A0A5B7K6F5_PORTR|nr:hypothetical protein [Portunus trituberculatus]
MQSDWEVFEAEPKLLPSPDQAVKMEDYSKEELYDQEVEVESKEDAISGLVIARLEDEVQHLKGICADLLAINCQLRDNRSTLSRKPLLKPQDIPVLKLHSLKGVEGEGNLSVFHTQVKNCSDNNEERQRIVTTRVEPQIGVFVQTLQKKHQNRKWDRFKELLTEELTDRSKDNLFDAISAMQYQLQEGPAELAANLKCRFASLEVRTNRAEIPDVIKTIKNKLMQGLPRDSCERLQLFKDDNVPFNPFAPEVKKKHALRSIWAARARQDLKLQY